MDISLSGKTVLITGGASGAGKTIVSQFLKTGADIAFTCLHSEAQIPETLFPGQKIRAYSFDQSELSQIDPLLEKIMLDFGHLDVLVNNAGIYPAKAFEKISEADWDAMMDVNLKGVFFLSKAAAEKMKEGSIVNISSINAYNPASALVHYGISKAGVEMETRALACELGPSIRVNCIAPGLIYKKGQEEFIPGWVESYCERAALKRLVRAEDIGNTAIFLVSDLSAAITGQIITVDCGVSLAPYFDNHLEDQ